MANQSNISNGTRGSNPLQDKSYYNGILNKYGITTEENFYRMLKSNRDFAKEYWYRQWRDQKISKEDYDAIKADMGLSDFEDDSKFNQFMTTKGFDIAKVVAAAMSAYGGYLAYGALAGSSLADKLGDKQSNTNSDAVTVASATGNTVTGSGYYGAGDTSRSSRPNTGNWFDTIISALTGNGSFSGAGILSALTGIGSQFANSAWNMHNTEKLIDKMNEYNTPANQMQRFADAGLNPNLVYGLGSNGNQGNAGTIAPVDFDTSQRENRMAQMQFELSKKQVEADIAQKQSAVELNHANAAEADERRIAQANTNSIFEMHMQIVGAQLDRAIAEADIALKEAKGWKEKRDAELALWRAEKAKKLFDSQSHSKAGGLFWDIVNLSKGLNESFQNGIRTWTPDRISPITPPFAGR